MNSIAYKEKRKALGYTQSELAAELAVRQATVSDRENEAAPITREAWLALNALPKKRKVKNVL